MIAIVVAGVVLLYLVSNGSISLSGGGIFGALGAQPPVGGADGSPQSIAAANYSQTKPVGNSEQNVAHGLESAIGGVGGAAVCTYYGAGAAAPLCAKAGAYLGPKAVQLGNFTTIKTVQASELGTNLGLKVVTTGANIGTNLANKGASYADRAYSGVGALPGPLGIVGKASVLPIKVAADVGAKTASLVGSGAGAVAGGVKSAGKAVESGVKSVLGWL